VRRERKEKRNKKEERGGQRRRDKGKEGKEERIMHKTKHSARYQKTKL
jgi:hypothetical protein